MHTYTYIHGGWPVLGASSTSKWLLGKNIVPAAMVQDCRLP